MFSPSVSWPLTQALPPSLASSLRARPALQALDGHQPCDAVQAGCLAFIDKVFLHPSRSQRPPTVFVKPTDTPQQAFVVELAGTG